MDESLLSFSDRFDGSRWASPTKIAHILCLDGTLNFSVQHIRYNVSKGDYVIFTPGIFATDVLQSHDCELLMMSFDQTLALKCAIISDYGAMGYLALLQNPVMRLSHDDFVKCREDLSMLRGRNKDTEHYFYEKMISSLLKVHILNLYDIHARANGNYSVKSRPVEIMNRFIGMLVKGDYRTERRLEYYSSALCVTPHYLSDVSNMISRHPATYWINEFVAREIAQLLMQKELTLSEIAFKLNFASVSYLSRFVSNHLGMTPSEFRLSTNQLDR